jgi:nucleoside-diphosphate-sugar epimerase
LAGRAHSPVGDEDRANYVRDNIDAGRHMLDAAAARGVGRFVFVSSVKVNGEETRTQPFRADDRPAPQDVYGQTKWETERNLSERAEQLGIELVVVRPPLVYGPGVKGNFARLIRWVQRGVPLPFGRIENHRSLVSVFNLCDLLIRCTEHPDAAGRTFMVSDGDDVSTPELVRRLASALGRRDRLVPISPRLLWLVARTSRQEGVYRRLCGSLQVDITATRRLLAWEPPVPLGEGVRRTVAEVAR